MAPSNDDTQHLSHWHESDIDDVELIASIEAIRRKQFAELADL